MTMSVPENPVSGVVVEVGWAEAGDRAVRRFEHRHRLLNASPSGSKSFPNGVTCTAASRFVQRHVVPRHRRPVGVTGGQDPDPDRLLGDVPIGIHHQIGQIEVLADERAAPPTACT